MTCVKYLLFGFNLLFFIFGLALLGVGIYVQIELKQYLDFFASPINAPAVLLIVVGSITLIVGFFGCCGAVKEHYCMTITFSVLIGLLLIIEIAAGITGYVLRADVNDLVNTGLTQTIGQYNDSEHGGVTKAWDNLQMKLECCGVTNSSDYTKAGKEVPPSCGSFESTGCLKKLEDTLAANILYVAGVAIGLAVVQLIGIVFACCLGRAIKREHSYA